MDVGPAPNELPTVSRRVRPQPGHVPEEVVASDLDLGDVGPGGEDEPAGVVRADLGNGDVDVNALTLSRRQGDGGAVRAEAGGRLQGGGQPGGGGLGVVVPEGRELAPARRAVEQDAVAALEGAEGGVQGDVVDQGLVYVLQEVGGVLGAQGLQV